MNVVVLLSTYNGSLFLREQLDSLFSQTHMPSAVIVRDDGSVDNTLDILNKYNVRLLSGNENKGPKNSFSLLLKEAVLDEHANYFMFCDQDDVWYSDKIEKTLSKMLCMERKFGDVPILVHTDLEVVDEHANTLAESMWKFEYILPKKNSLNRLLMQNTITGCTVMMNRNLLGKCVDIPGGAVMHDWWVGLVASYFGEIGYLSETTIKYRQHSGNSIGAKGFKAGVAYRFPKLLKKIFIRDDRYISSLKVNIRQAYSFLVMYENEIDYNSRRMLLDFSELEKKTFFERRLVLLRHNLIKQGYLRNIALFIRM